ncbi:hypothetical protein LINPERHAP2_LOCUS2883 [Linum perenne]
MISSLDQTSTLRFSRLFKDDKLQENDEHDELQLGEQSNTPNLSKSDKMETSTSREDGFSKKETRIHNPALMEELGDSLGTEDIPQAPQHILKRHPPSQVIGNLNTRLITRSKSSQNAFVPLIEQKILKMH